MKSMVVSASFLAAAIILTVINSYFVNMYLSEALDMLYDIPLYSEDMSDGEKADAATKILQVCKYWESHLKFLSLSINSAKLRDCTVSLNMMHAFAESTEACDYKSELYTSQVRIRELMEQERFLFMNIV